MTIQQRYDLAFTLYPYAHSPDQDAPGPRRHKFVGFGLGAMPVGLAAMKRLVITYGDAPRAFLVITLAASLFTDTANALIVQSYLTWFGK